MKEVLEDYRKTINALDEEIVGLLLRRFAVCDDVADYKKCHGLAVRDAEREKAVIERLTAGQKDADASCIRGLYETMFAVCREREQKRMEETL